jgi:hypothetical protein
MYGPRRFSELKADLPGISANVLTQRLAELEARGLVRKARLPPPASVQVYEATEWGKEAAPVMGHLGQWAARSPLHDPSMPISHVSVIMSLQTMLNPRRAFGLTGRLGFRLGEVSYVTILHDGRLDVDRGPIQDCDVTFTALPAELVAVVYGGAPLETISVQGDIELARRFITLFPLPPTNELKTAEAPSKAFMTDLPNVQPESRSETLMASPDKIAKVRELFGVDTDMEVPAFSEADERLIWTTYVFDPNTARHLRGLFESPGDGPGYHGTGKSTISGRSPRG